MKNLPAITLCITLSICLVQAPIALGQEAEPPKQKETLQERRDRQALERYEEKLASLQTPIRKVQAMIDAGDLKPAFEGAREIRRRLGEPKHVQVELLLAQLALVDDKPELAVDFLDPPVTWTHSAGVTVVESNPGSLKVKYTAVSNSAAKADAEWIQGTSNGETSKAYRTVFSVQLALNFANNLHGDNNLRFDKTRHGDNNDGNCGITWAGEAGAGIGIGAKMETVAMFTPTGIQWEKRGVSFAFGTGDESGKGTLRLHRKKIETSLLRKQNLNNGQRIITKDFKGVVTGNDEDWVYDGKPDPDDAQYPTASNPDRAFRIDSPGVISAVGYIAFVYRTDFTEFTEWHDGDSWSSISDEEEGKWYANLTGDAPSCGKGNPTGHGSGHNATEVPNSKPVAAISSQQGITVNPGTVVTLSSSNSTDPDVDQLPSP